MIDDAKTATENPKGDNVEDDAIVDITHYQTSDRQVEDDEPEAGTSLWLITFTDAMALMLTFFVLLYSMSKPEEETWSQLTGAINQEFNKFYAPKWDNGLQQDITIDKIDFDRALDLNYLRAVMAEILTQDDKLEGVYVAGRSDRLIISLPNDLLFESGSPKVNAKGKKALYSLGEFFEKIKNRIEIVGHADPVPVQGGEFHSNWHLSLARAMDVAGVLERLGYEKPVIVQGFSSARYDELPEKIQGEERRQLSRRVDIIIMKDTGTKRGSFGVLQ